MDQDIIKCNDCGIIVDIGDRNIDQCTRKRFYCELCMAQKNPYSETEHNIKKKYIRITIISTFIVLMILIAASWGKTQNDNLFEYIIGYGLSYFIIWIFTAIVLIPVLMTMKKPHKEKIKKEKDISLKEIIKKKELRKTLLEQQEKA